MSQTQISEILINKKDLTDTKCVEHTFDTADLGEHQVLLRVESAGFSANNVTYALLGERAGYWGFFPAEDGWGKVPLWGFAIVEASNHPDIETGEKVFGYLPSASHLVITAGKVSSYGFSDVDDKRKSIAPLYDNYQRCATDPGYVADKEAWQLNYRPLFMTSFVLDDYSGERITDNTKRVLLTSASSKTAYGCAHLLLKNKSVRGQNYQVVGLTSASNKDFVSKTGCYDDVLSYDEAINAEFAGDSILLDFTGNRKLLGNIKSKAEGIHFVFIGATDVVALSTQKEGQVEGELFSAPAQVKKRTVEWGQETFAKHYAAAWLGFSENIENLVSVRELEGAETIRQLYLGGLAGKLDAKEILVARF